MVTKRSELLAGADPQLLGCWSTCRCLVAWREQPLPTLGATRRPAGAVRGTRSACLGSRRHRAWTSFVNDHGLREHHKDRYDRFGRWLLAAAVLQAPAWRPSRPTAKAACTFQGVMSRPRVG